MGRQRPKAFALCMCCLTAVSIAMMIPLDG